MEVTFARKSEDGQHEHASPSDSQAALSVLSSAAGAQAGIPLFLQASAGDRVSQPGEPLEREADLVADHVARTGGIGTFATSFGRDLADVRIHTGSDSAAAARHLDAQAFTIGNDIHFGANRYQPETPAGQHLLAHELTHSLQQRAGGQPVVHRAVESKSGSTVGAFLSDVYEAGAEVVGTGVE